MLHIIWSIIIGAIIGWLAEVVVPGAHHLGFIKCAVLGIVGGIIGGLIGRLFSKPAPGSSFHPAGFFMSLVCAIILLIVYIKFIAHAA
ncbi:MAG: GlsB/YeaQ/YmgE family stress response membrane protein [Verrucomicrobiota bacterium]|nr:GlsB/YeaQ/YmgE family stress response membrane protein [Verrucomicrobiota bacterium]